MKKNTKVALGLFLTIGIVGVAAYFIRQAKLLKNICVKAGGIDWEATLIEAFGVYTSGSPISDFSLPLDLTLINNSNSDVTIKKVQLDLYAEGDKIGVVATDFEQILAKSSESVLSVDFVFDEGVSLVALGAAELLGSLDLTIIGTITAEASVFETIEIKYLSTFTASGLIKSEESGGNCG
jgi:hypothetical protein